jgi:cytochrome c-type biogenesis protein CcmH
MSLTLPSLLLIAAAIALSALFIVVLRPSLVRPALLSRLRSSSRKVGQDLRGTGTLVMAAVAFLLVAGIGTAASYLRQAPEAAGAGDTISLSRSHSGLDGETLARLEGFAGSTGTEEPPSMAAAGKLLPDVNTMIERLAARLETMPGDVKGWRMLGWSYAHTGRYEQAVTAYAKAMELDPNSAELKRSYEEAKAKASGQHAADTTQPEAMPSRGHDGAIRSMVDGLAARLESSPRDVEGWTRLMRSRLVLGEREAAAAAFSKALEVFKDDRVASGKVKAAAIELGLKAE